MKEYPILYDTKEECCGCAACHDICPEGAISLVPDEEGFSYPIIDEDICICCFQCIKVCPLKTRL